MRRILVIEDNMTYLQVDDESGYLLQVVKEGMGGELKFFLRDPGPDQEIESILAAEVTDEMMDTLMAASTRMIARGAELNTHLMISERFDIPEEEEFEALPFKPAVKKAD